METVTTSLIFIRKVLLQDTPDLHVQFSISKPKHLRPSDACGFRDSVLQWKAVSQYDCTTGMPPLLCRSAVEENVAIRQKALLWQKALIGDTENGKLE